ncbi:ABC transporter substrate-binding protein [Natronosalvus halobius]|uniref:ABC transporter substrate-binding protein n=1 Tax=Natronosalvus halobius TaxID=2953746 RepID=UPI0020A118FF|nr:ABC transporter substrate-binding protein [Natronosalvus halobius]USZ70743.1 ABC transporter substrate-binding protein [Natronosalvus halobius]
MDRRSLLAATAAGCSLSLSGCVRELRSAVNRDRLEPLSVTITTQPADGDRQSIRLSREIAANLEAVGIDVHVELRSPQELRRQVLVNHDFDLVVDRHPGGTDPDFLYEALYSRYAEESGWQNPFGVTNMAVDDLLERQRRVAGADRREVVEQLATLVAREQPFVPICRPDEVRLVRTSRFDGWRAEDITTRLGYLGLEPVGEGGQLRGAIMDAAPSQNVNPLSAAYRGPDPVVDLMYDPLVIEPPDDDEVVAWLAKDWTWTGGEGGGDGDSNGNDGGDGSDDGDDGDGNTGDGGDSDDGNDNDDGTLEVTLREHAFHDGEPVTADDVRFTYEFLADTSMGTSDVPAPSPRYRGRISAVQSVDVLDERTLEFTVDGTEAIAERALVAPILPRHVWESRSDPPNVPGVRLAQGTTKALVANNFPPIGSGPYQYADHVDRQHLTLERSAGHFTTREEVDLPAPTAESFRVQIDPRSTSAISLIRDGDSDVTISPLEAYVLDDVESDDDVERIESETAAFYHLGFNVRRAPFGDPYFRRAVAGVIDEAWLAETVFHGHADPIATPLSPAWTPSSLAFDDENGDPVVPFHGSDGNLDVDAARAAFEDAGYHYDGDALVVRQ